MSIRWKLTLNVIFISIVILGGIFLTFIIIGFFKNKLSDLTERSTPYQVRTLELQRAIQSTIASLAKVSAARNLEEYKTYRGEVEETLSEMKKAQEKLEKLTSEKLNTYRELNVMAEEVYDITERRLKSEIEAEEANKLIDEKIKAISKNLGELDKKIRDLQLNRLAAYTTSVLDTKRITSKRMNTEGLKFLLKELEVEIVKLNQALDKKALLIHRGKVNAITNKIMQNDYIKEDKSLTSEVRNLIEKLEEIIKLSLARLEQPNFNSSKLDSLFKEVSEKLSSLLLKIEQEMASINEKYTMETSRQEENFTQSNIATNVLLANAELQSLGLTLQSLSLKLFTLRSTKELEIYTSEINKIFERITGVEKKLKNFLAKLNAKEELEILSNTSASFNAVKGALLAKEGVITKIRHFLEMQEKVKVANQKVREIVLKQAERSKQIVTSAQEEQEKAISSASKVIKYSTWILILIGIVVITIGMIYGYWIYRAISKPLNNLIDATEIIAQGHLVLTQTKDSKDEIGMVQKSMNKMVENVRKIILEIKTFAATLASSSEELSSTVKSIEESSDQQMNEIIKSVESLNKMSKTIVEIDKIASNTSNMAQEMKRVAIEGKENMKESIQRLDSFVKFIRELADKTEELNEKSKAVNNVIRIIKDIADQTKLLALNASIEASRAGVHGRGFAVVAENVRQLAERTTLSAEEITKTIKAMEEEMTTSVNMMEQGKVSAEVILENIKNTLTSIELIVKNIEGVTDMIGQTASALAQQSSNSQEVTHKMEIISDHLKQLNNSIDWIKSAVDELAKIASNLNVMADWFKV